MKNFTFLIFFFIGFSCVGQSVLEFTSNDTIYTIVQSQSEEGIAEFVNSSNEDQIYYWTREIICAPNAWQIAIGTNGFEYAPFVESSPQDLQIAPQDTNELIVYISPIQTPGIAEVHLNIYLRNNPDSAILTGVYLFNGGCQSVNTNSILSNNEIDVFPNPTNSKIQIKADEGLKMQSIRVFDISGNLNDQHVLNQTSTFDLNLENYASGIYFLAIEMSDGRVGRRKVVLRKE